MSGRTLAIDEVVIKTVVALTEAHAGFVSDTVACKGLEWVALHLDYTYDSATSVEIAMENSADGSTPWRSCRKSDSGTGAIDQVSEAFGASADATHVFFVGPYEFVRFTAKRTGGSASDTLAMSHSGV